MKQSVKTAMKKAEYHLHATGGGCDAYVKEYGQYEIWVTHTSNAPTKWNQTVDVGLYKDEGQTGIGMLELSGVDELLKMDERLLVNKLLGLPSSWIYVCTVSGEGYSTPTLELFRSKAAAEGRFKNVLGNETSSDIEKKSEHDYIIKYEDNYYRAQLIEVPDGLAYIVRVDEPNEVSLVSFGDKLSGEMATLRHLITKERWEEDEEEYDEISREYGAHTDDGYVHFQLLTDEKLNEDEPQSELEKLISDLQEQVKRGGKTVQINGTLLIPETGNSVVITSEKQM